MNREWIGCASTNFRPGRPAAMRPEAIVVHVIAGSLASADSWFNDPVAHVSAHYGVGFDGRVHQYVAENDTAFHAGIVVNPTAAVVLQRPNTNPNFYTIGVEHEGQPENDWTSPQSDASAELIVEIAQRWNISLDAQHVIGHREIRASKTCPGDLKKVSELIQAASAILGQPVPASASAVRTITNVRVRRGAPNTVAPIVKVIPADTIVVTKGFVVGELVQGFNAWYRDADGNFFWAGATNAPIPR